VSTETGELQLHDVARAASGAMLVAFGEQLAHTRDGVGPKRLVAALGTMELTGALLNGLGLERLGSAANIAVVARVRRELPAQVPVTLERLACEPLSANTVKDHLHKTARRPDGPVEPIGYGRYVFSPSREKI
jgi:hypothetical protein